MSAPEDGSRSDNVRTKVASRERTAQRLLKSSAERSYDPHIDIDWDAPDVPGLKFVPDRYISLYGTPFWDEMTEVQRVELGRHEAGTLAQLGIMIETALMHALLKVAATNDPRSGHAQYAYTEVADECRHSTMFGRQIDALGSEIYQVPKWVSGLIGFAALAPTKSTLLFAGILLGEELLDRMQRETMGDLELQPRTRAVARIHVIEEARHISYAREELTRLTQTLPKAQLAVERLLLAAASSAVRLTFINPLAYRTVGLDPRAASRAALASPNNVANAQFLAEKLMKFFRDSGMMKGRVTRKLWYRSKLVPQGFCEQV